MKGEVTVANHSRHTRLDPDFMGIPEFAARLGMNHRSVLAIIREGKPMPVSVIRVGGHYRVSRAAVQALIEGRTGLTPLEKRD